MGKVHMVCLPVTPEGQDSDDGKAVNRRFAELAAKLHAVGVHTRQMSVPKLPEMSYTSLDKVTDGITAFEPTLVQFSKELRGGAPLDDGHKRALCQIEEFVWDAIEFPVDNFVQVIAIPGKIKDRVQKIMQEHGEKKAVWCDLAARASAMRQRTRSVVDGDLSLMVNPKDMHHGEYMGTMLVAVPLAKMQEWLHSYASLIPGKVAPGLAVEVTRDTQHALFRVLVLKSAVLEFTDLAAPLGFKVRQLDTGREEHARKFQAKERLLEEEKDAKDELLEWSFGTLCKVDHERIHLLALRASAESAKRNGNDALFMAFVAAPEDRIAERKMREILEGVAGSKNVLSSEDWKLYGRAGMYDGSDNFPYLSVPFEM